MEFIRENIHTTHGLHDMVASAIRVTGNDIMLVMDTGFIRCGDDYEQVEGNVIFYHIDWDFCYVYILENFTENSGKFSGEKLSLQNFIKQYDPFHFEIIDATYGYNQTKLSGWLSVDDKLSECVIEIYHNGDMVFVEK